MGKYFNVLIYYDYYRYIASYCHYYDNKDTDFKNLAAVVLPFIG